LLSFGYNTNGFAHHSLEECFDLLADLGYEGVGLSLDTHHLNPMTATAADVARTAAHLARRRLRVSIETGARFVLDPRRKHEPTLIAATKEARERRIDFLVRCLDIATDMGAESLAVFSGRFDPALALADCWQRLADGIQRLMNRSDARHGPPIAFEPEPGMFVDKLSRFDKLTELVGPRLKLTLDLGHVRCTERMSIPDAVRLYKDRIANVHIEDIKGTVHLHLPFGQGDIDFPPALGALEEIGYRGLVHVELSRDSHDAPEAARRSLDFLRKARQAWRSS